MSQIDFYKDKVSFGNDLDDKRLAPDITGNDGDIPKVGDFDKRYFELNTKDKIVLKYNPSPWMFHVGDFSALMHQNGGSAIRIQTDEIEETRFRFFNLLLRYTRNNVDYVVPIFWNYFYNNSSYAPEIRAEADKFNLCYKHLNSKTSPLYLSAWNPTAVEEVKFSIMSDFDIAGVRVEYATKQTGFIIF